jgi:hypothetical protein
MSSKASRGTKSTAKSATATFKALTAKQKGALGRSNANNLFSVNKDKAVEATHDKHFWEVSKYAHPINKMQYTRWQNQLREESFFGDRVSKLPDDFKHRITRHFVQPTFMRWLVPLAFLVYFAMCFVRYMIYGVTAAESSMNKLRYAGALPRLPTPSGAGGPMASGY